MQREFDMEGGSGLYLGNGFGETKWASVVGIPMCSRAEQVTGPMIMNVSSMP